MAVARSAPFGPEFLGAWRPWQVSFDAWHADGTPLGSWRDYRLPRDLNGGYDVRLFPNAGTLLLIANQNPGDETFVESYDFPVRHGGLRWALVCGPALVWTAYRIWRWRRNAAAARDVRQSSSSTSGG